MRLPTASQGAVLYMRWRMGPASWLEWPWPGGHGPFLDTPKPDQLAEDRFRHPQIGQFAEPFSTYPNWPVRGGPFSTYPDWPVRGGPSFDIPRLASSRRTIFRHTQISPGKPGPHRSTPVLRGPLWAHTRPGPRAGLRGGHVKSAEFPPSPLNGVSGPKRWPTLYGKNPVHGPLT